MRPRINASTFLIFDLQFTAYCKPLMSGCPRNKPRPPALDLTRVMPFLLASAVLSRYNSRMIRYKHALALYPYFGDSTAPMGIFPPTGLEYIAASMKDLVGKVTFLDLRYERAYQDLKVLSRLIRDEIDLLCISIQWQSRFKNVCDLISQLPREVCTVVGGYKATQEVEYLFERCPNVDMIVRGEGEEIIKQIVTGVPYEDIRGLSYRRNGRVVHNEIHLLPDVTRLPCSYALSKTMITEEMKWLTIEDLEWIMGRGVCEWLGWPLEK